MQRHVYKYPLIRDGMPHEIHVAGKPLKIAHFGYDGGRQLCAWVELDVLNHPTKMRYQVIPTGMQVPVEMQHAQTIIDDGFVWHLCIEPQSEGKSNG